jgi:putative glutamine amidotransferase
MARPLIGITCGTRSVGERPAEYRQNQAYVRAVDAAGGAPLLIPPVGNVQSARTLFDHLDGLILPGGTDVQPSAYGAEPHEKLGTVDPALDETEIALAHWALETDKPLLGICRGQQTLNVAAGGTLCQDIPSELPDALAHRVEPRTALAHSISATPGSRLAQIFGTTSFKVNSLHHQAVDRVASGFEVTALAPDGIIEGLEHPGRRFALSVQFHPEELASFHEPSRRLFAAFVKAAATQ